MNKISKVSSYFLIAMLLLGVFFVAIPAKAQATTLELVNPLDGTNTFEFTTSVKNVGDTFNINVTVADVTAMSGWQVSISWNASLLDYDNFVMPSDNVFAYDSPVFASFVSSGNIVAGANLGPSSPHDFTGGGTLGVLTLKIIQGVGIVPPTTVQCDLVFSNIGTDTYLLSGLTQLPDPVIVNAFYHFYWIEPSTFPSLYLQPSVIKPLSNGSMFAVDVMVNNVYAGWEITAFQFSIMWNTTLIAPAAPYFTEGTFLEAFEYAPGGVIYAMDLNTHTRLLPLSPIPDDYNYSIVGELLLPDMADPYNGTYHAPFPQSIGPALLGTFYFQAIYTTVSPTELWTTIDFIAEDVFVLNQYNNVIPYASLTGAQYRCPMTVTGLSIDVYTQYPYPYGGQGANQTSDSFGPQQEVCLFVLVTYNDYPVQQKLVGFEITHNGYHFTREGTTDANGIAKICFRLPWPCVDPVNEIFGWWYVNATVEVAGQVVVDNLKFWVWWPVEVVSIEPKFTSVVQSKQGTEMCFEMIYRRFDVLPLNVTLTATVYDELGFFIGFASTVIYNFGATGEINATTGEPIPIYGNWTFCIPIPSNAVVGKAIIYGNAFTDWPWFGGYPYAPEVTNTIDFFIAAPP